METSGSEFDARFDGPRLALPGAARGLLSPALIFALAAIQGIALAIFGPKGVVLLPAVVGALVLAYRPHLVLVPAVFLFLDGFGFFNPDDFSLVRGLPTVQDVVFLSLFLPLLLSGKWQSRARRIVWENRALLAPVAAILILAALQMVRTSQEYGIPLRRCVKTGWHYWYYAVLPLVAIYADTAAKRKTVFRMFMGLMALLATIVITQTVLLSVGGGLFLDESVSVAARYWGGFEIWRIYVPGEPLLVLGFAVAFWAVSQRPAGAGQFGYALLAVWFAVAILAVHSRMRWAHAILIVLVPLLFFGRRVPGKYRGVIGMAGLFLLAVTTVVLVLDPNNTVLSAIGKKVQTATTDVLEGKGTWGGRLEDFQFRFDLIRESPWLGAGFIPAEHAADFGAVELDGPDGEPYVDTVQTTDSGVVALLVDLGIVGMACAAWYWLAAVGFCLRKPRLSGGDELQWLSIPMASYLVSGAIVLVTLCLFSQPGDVLGSGMGLGLLAASAVAANASASEGGGDADEA